LDTCCNHSDRCFGQGIPPRMDRLWVSHWLINGLSQALPLPELLPLISKTAYNIRFYTH
jgi:hypothetical protein